MLRLFALPAALLACAVCPAAADGPDLRDLLKQPAYLAAYQAIVAPIDGREAWVSAAGKGPEGHSPDNRPVEIGGEHWTLSVLCRTRDCDEQLVVLFSPGGKAALGLLRKPGLSRYLGKTDSATRKVLLEQAREHLATRALKPTAPKAP